MPREIPTMTFWTESESSAGAHAVRMLRELLYSGQYKPFSRVQITRRENGTFQVEGFTLEVEEAEV